MDRLTLGTAVKYRDQKYYVIGDGYDHDDKYGLIIKRDGRHQFVKPEEITIINDVDITPDDAQVVQCRTGERSVLNHGCSSATHKAMPYKIGDVLKDSFGNILTVMTRGDIVYYFCAKIDSYIYQLANMDNTVLGTNNEVCAMTGKPLTDKLEIHTRCGILNINVSDTPEFFLPSCLSGKYYEPQFSHLVIGKDYENLHIGYDEMDLVKNNPDLAICPVTNIPFYIEDERPIVKETGVHPIIVDELVVTCPITHKHGIKQHMLTGYKSNLGVVYFHPDLKDKLICHNGSYGETEDDFITVVDTGEKHSKAMASQFYLCSNGQYYSSRDAAPLSGIHPYNFKPKPKFQGEGKKFIGIELEYHHCGESDSRADRIISSLAEVIYAKHDGSLNDGMEFVTHPCTPKVHLLGIDWGGFMTRLKDCGGQASEGSGIHMHVNRNFFKNELCIARMIRFIENHHDTILYMSNRDSNDRNWCEKYRYTVKELRSIFHVAQESNAKYRALNLCPRHTIEFRMFRSTTDVPTLYAYIQFIDVLTSVANMESIPYIGWSHIRNLAKKRKYKELLDLLDKKNIAKKKEK